MRQAGRMDELVRHFFFGFFSTDLAASQDQFRRLLTGILVGLAGAGLVAPATLYRKFMELGTLEDPNPFQQALRADLLFFLTITMLVMALVALFEWAELFPDRRDWLILGPLPITRARMFLAKLIALSQFAGLFTVFLTVLPSLVVPAMMSGWKGHWQSASPPRFVFSYFVASTAACVFVFYGAATLQGLLLHLAPPRWWPRISLGVQALLLMSVLIAVPFTIEIPGLAPHAQDWRAVGQWLPPVWFLEAMEQLAGRPPLFDAGLAKFAWLGFFLFPVATVGLYWTSYRRGAEWLLAAAGGTERAEPNRLFSWLADRLFPMPGPRAIAAFTAKTLSRSRTHKLLFAGYAGLGLALVVDGFLSVQLAQHLRNRAAQQQGWVMTQLAVPLVLLFFVLSGLRHIFMIPVELRAQWLFRLREDAHRATWLDTTERFLILAAIVPALAVAAVTTASLGLTATLLHMAMVAMLGLVLLEVVLFDWDQVPFACGYRPGDQEVSQTLVLYWIGFSLFAYFSTSLEAWALQGPWRFLGLYVVLAFAYALLRRLRRQEWGELPLQFTGEEAPVVQALGLGGD